MGSEDRKDKQSHHLTHGLGRVASAATEAVEGTAGAAGTAAGAAVGAVSKGVGALMHHRPSDTPDTSAHSEPVEAVGRKQTTETASPQLERANSVPNTTNSKRLSSSFNQNSADDGSDGSTEPTSDDDEVFKFAVLYWRHSFGIPENGRMSLSSKKNTLKFIGITGTRILFDLKTQEVEIEKASRMGGYINDAIRIRVKQPSEDKFIFTPVMHHRKEIIRRVQAVIAKVDNDRNDESSGGNNNQKEVPGNVKVQFRMPPDATLQKMKSIAKQKLKGVSVKDYFEVAWSEGESCDKNPMYGPFLKSQGKNNVKISQWEEGQFKGSWCGENYSRQRFVTFDFMKQTIGQTLVQVKHTQRCRLIDGDQCIVHMTLEMKGFPYADCFVVEVRHVASRIGEHDLQVEIGIFVKFLKSCMFESKIRTNTSLETSNIMKLLLEKTVEGCKPYATHVNEAEKDDINEEEDDDNDMMIEAVRNHQPTTTSRMPEPLVHAIRAIIVVFVAFFRSYVKPYVNPLLTNLFPPSSVEEGLQCVKEQLDLLEEVALDSVSGQEKSEVSKEISSIKKSLKKIKQLSEAKSGE